MELLTFCFYCILVWAVYWFFPRSEKSLKGQRALITGGGSGIGRLMAIEFAREGCSVVIWDINGQVSFYQIYSSFFFPFLCLREIPSFGDSSLINTSLLFFLILQYDFQYPNRFLLLLVL